MKIVFDRNSSGAVWAARVAGLIALAGAAAAMLWISWGKWPDVLVDFGHELYIPWMLAEGKMLYRDLLNFRGPFSPYWNALWFVLFGPGLYTLVWVNLALLAIMMVVMHQVLRRVSSSFASFAACLVFILLFAFSQHAGIANYNYVCPYAHETTHAMLLSWVVLACLMKHVRSPKMAWPSLSGFLTGMVFLIKPEFFVALMAASAAALGLWAWRMRPGIALAARSIGAFIVTLLISPFAAFALLSTQLTWAEAGVGALGEWWYILNSRVSALSFFRTGMGIENPLVNLKAMLTAAGIYAYIFLSAAAPAMVFRRRQAVFLIAFMEVLIVLGSAGLFWENLFWFEVARPLPLLLILLFGWKLIELIRHREEKHQAAVILIVFSLALLAKMLLNTRIFHYGFVLAMPAVMVSVVAVFDWIPAAIKDKGGRPVIFYAAAFALFGVITIRYMDISEKRYALKSVPVGKCADRFLADRRGELVNLAVDWLNRNMKTHETLAVLPEGTMINYLTRRKNSSPIITVVPPDIVMFGESRILQLIREAPPTFIALVHRDDSEFGYRFFGLDYGQSIMHWLREEYRPVQLIGDLPFQDNRFGILIIERKDLYLPAAPADPPPIEPRRPLEKIEPL
ncbi:MAG: hypothetical protein C4522_18475 [Desulfobacteraceae bacterium]|nr:MAG: hypothetical protein C4522_18475 [Desulfobacteraceae bacterium]